MDTFFAKFYFIPVCFNLLIILLSHFTYAHVSLTYPPARKYDLDFLDNIRTNPPCGMPKGALGTTLLAGVPINVSWHLSYPHRGGYRLELLDKDEKFLMNLVKRDKSEDYVEGDPTAQWHTITIPKDKACNDCSIRLLRQASEWANHYRFWSCADVKIVSGENYAEDCFGHGKSDLGGCRCDKNFWGPRCQFEDECQSDTDCGKGTCIDLGGTALPRRQCFCPHGVHGEKCSLTNKAELATRSTLDLTTHTKRELSDRMSVHYKVIAGGKPSEKEVEFVLVVNGTSYGALGWRPTAFNKSCKLWPYVDEKLLTRKARQTHGPKNKVVHRDNPTLLRPLTPEERAMAEPEPEMGMRQVPSSKPKPSKLVPEPEPEAEVEPHSEPEPENGPKPGGSSNLIVKPRPGPKLEPQAESESNPEPHPEPEQPSPESELEHVAPESEPKSKPKHPVPESEPKPETEPNPEPEHAVPESEPKPETEPSPEPEQAAPESEPKPEHTLPESEPQSETEPKPEPEHAAPESEPKPEGVPKSEPHLNREPENSIPESQPEGFKKPLNKSPLQPQAEVSSEPESEPESNTAAEPEPEKHNDHSPEPEPESSSFTRETRKSPYSPKGDFHAMDCTDIIMGAARGANSRILDYYTRDRSTPRLDSFWGGVDSITSATGWQTEDGITVLIFRRRILATEAPDHDIQGTMQLIWARGQEQGKYVHSPKSGIEKESPSVPNFYAEDEIKYHGHRGQRGVTFINFEF